MQFRHSQGLIWTNSEAKFAQKSSMKHLSILVQDDQTSLSTVACIVGASQVFSEANRCWIQGSEAKFEIALVGASVTHPLQNGFITIQPQLAIADIHQTDLADSRIHDPQL
ncbi:MAG: hypothetical protein U0176_18285 [Bacteroidia bacterium]